MVDVVPNHVAWDGPGSSVDYSRFNPFNDQSYYHKYCEIDDSDNQTNAEDVSTNIPLRKVLSLSAQTSAGLETARYRFRI